ncbi:MAG: 2-keto-3-deoxygluconate permease [Pygmaiobacter massiliensis]|nr:2-keto-3-deoxygluconate permease [Pygmaiobacter massiliensis]
MKILETVKKVPAGIILIPTLIGAAVHTFCPELLQLGDPTEGMFTSKGLLVIVGFMLFFMGTQFRLAQLPRFVRRGVPFCLFRYFVGYLPAFLLWRFLGLEGVFGLSFLAVFSALPSTNTMLLAGTVAPWADETDNGIVALLTLTGVPVVPLLILGGASGNADITGVISMVVPFVFGLVLGNLDEQVRKLYAHGMEMLLPFAGFQFGSVIDLRVVVQQIPAGLLLMVLYYVAVGVPLFLFDTLALRRPGYFSLANCALAGITLSLPTLAAAADATYAPWVQTATAQMACALFLTTVLTPMLTNWYMQTKKRRQTAQTIL